jgi:hypothetical protein
MRGGRLRSGRHRRRLHRTLELQSPVSQPFAARDSSLSGIQQG